MAFVHVVLVLPVQVGLPLECTFQPSHRFNFGPYRSVSKLLSKVETSRLHLPLLMVPARQWGSASTTLESPEAQAAWGICLSGDMDSQWLERSIIDIMMEHQELSAWELINLSNTNDDWYIDVLSS